MLSDSMCNIHTVTVAAGATIFHTQSTEEGRMFVQIFRVSTGCRI